MNCSRSAAAKSRFGPLLIAVFLAVLAVLPALTAAPGAAAGLPLLPGSITSRSIADRCTDTVHVMEGVTVTGEATTVMMTGLDHECAGNELDLTLFDAEGEALMSTNVILEEYVNGATTLEVPAYAPPEVAGAAVRIATWGVPATWTYTPPAATPLVTCSVINDPTGTKTCEVTDVKVDAWGYPVFNTYNFYATIRSSSPSEDVEWELTIHLAEPELEVHANAADSNNGVMLAPGWSCSSMPFLKLRGNGEVGTQYVGGEKTFNIWMQGKIAASPTDGSLFNCS